MVGGACTTWKIDVEYVVPLGDVTDSVPLVVPAATTPVIEVSPDLAKLVSAVPLMAAVVAVVKPVPVMVIDEPARTGEVEVTQPEFGVKPVMTGGFGSTVKLLPEVPVVLVLVTLIAPVAAPAGTIAEIWVELSTV